MFQPLLIMSSLSLPPAFEPVEKYSVPTHKIYIAAPITDPVLPKWKSPFSDRPESTTDWIQQNIDTQMYKPVIEELEH